MDKARITEMEQVLNEGAGMTRELSALLDRMEQMKDPVSRLFRYYGSAEWFEDREEDLPKDLPAGVLSEDGIYNELQRYREMNG